MKNYLKHRWYRRQYLHSKWRKIVMVNYFVLLTLISLDRSFGGGSDGFDQWENYGGTKKNSRYSTLDQINRKNVHRLELAWSYENGDSQPGSEMQCNPVVLDGILYATTPQA